MNRIILAALLFCSVSHAATLSWDPSPITGGSPPAVNYQVQCASVGNPGAATWNVYGASMTTSILLTNNPYLMFRVLGMSSGGVPSDPSNVVTNTLAKPQSPGNAIIGAMIESAPTPAGPFTLEKTFTGFEVVMSTNRFYRSRVEVQAR